MDISCRMERADSTCKEGTPGIELCACCCSPLQNFLNDFRERNGLKGICAEDTAETSTTTNIQHSRLMGMQAPCTILLTTSNQRMGDGRNATHLAVVCSSSVRYLLFMSWLYEDR